MYPVTQDFLEQMKATERRVYGRIQIDYTDPFLDQSIQVQASEQANVSYPAQTADAVAEPFAKIASLDGSWVLDGTYALAPSTAEEATTHQMGWWGSQLSGADGSFTTPYPTLTVTFFSRPITQLKVVGDSKRGEYPVDFDIHLYDANGTILYTESVVGNTQVTWQKTLANPITQVTKMDLVIKKWSHAGRQVKILEFFTSIQEVYEGDDILLIHLLEEREVSQGSLPVGNISANEIDIRLDNSTRKFDAGNKQSPLYQLLKQNRRIKAWLGVKADGDGSNIAKTEATQTDFQTGTLTNAISTTDGLQLSKTGVDYSKVETTQDDFQAGTLTNVVATSTGDLELAGYRDKYNTDPIVANRFKGLTGTWAYDSTNKWIRQTDSSSNQHWGVEISFPFVQKIDFEFDMQIESDPSGRVHAGAFIQTVDNQVTGYRITHLDAGWVFSKWNDGVETGLTATIINNVSLAVGQIIHLRVVHDFTTGDGALYANGTQVMTWHDTSYTQGRPGFHNYGCVVHYDNLVMNASSSGSRLSPIYDISPVGIAASSTISWNATLPANTSLTIETNLSLDGGVTWQGWQVCTNGGAIPGITKGTNLSNARLQLKQTLSTTDTTVTPSLQDITITILTGYYANGERLSPVIDLTPVGYVCGTAISWEAITPLNTSLIIETSIDGGVTWQACTNKGRIPGINPGDNLAGKQLLIRQKLSTSDVAVTPQLSRLTLAVNHEEWVPLGTFWSGDWSVPEDGVFAQTTGRDRLELLRKSTYSTSTVQTNKTLYDLAVAVLQDAGLKSEEYWVDTELQQYTIPYAYFEPMSHREALRIIAEACLGQVYCDRNGIVRVEGPSYLASKTVADLTITQDDYFRKDNPVKWEQIANYIEVETQPLRPDVMQEVYRSNDPVSIAAGQTLMLTVYYNQTPCINAAASLTGATNTVITAATYYAWGADITLVNNGTSAESVTIVINAQPLKVMNKEKAVAKDEQSITDNGLIRYTFPENPLVQTLSMAQTIANKLLASFKDPRRDVEVEWRGNPALLLGDRVSVIDNVETNDYFVIRQELEYDGALRAKLSGRRAT